MKQNQLNVTMDAFHSCCETLNQSYTTRYNSKQRTFVISVIGKTFKSYGKDAMYDAYFEAVSYLIMNFQVFEKFRSDMQKKMNEKNKFCYKMEGINIKKSS